MDTLVSLGYWGLFIGSFLASTIIPMSADVLLVGVLALGGNVWGCLAIATVGNWLGGLTSYWIGWLGRWDWIVTAFGLLFSRGCRSWEICLPLPSDFIVSVRRCPLSICSWGVSPAFWCGYCCISSTLIVLSSGSVDPVTVTSYHWNHRHRMNHRRIHQMTRHRC